MEDVDWCRSDLRACLDFLESRGHTRVALVGHSLGAVKVIYYQARLADPRVAAIVALSPPRLSYSYLAESEAAEEFLDNMRRAEELSNDRRPGALFEVSFPVRHYFSAANYISKLGPKEKYNVMTLAEGITVPLLAVAGSRELRVIEGGNHIYRDREQEAAQLIHQWIESLEPAETVNPSTGATGSGSSPLGQYSPIRDQVGP